MTAPFFSLLVALIGVVLYLGSPNGKISEAGRILYFCGVLAFLLKTGGIFR